VVDPGLPKKAILTQHHDLVPEKPNDSYVNLELTIEHPETADPLAVFIPSLVLRSESTSSKEVN